MGWVWDIHPNTHTPQKIGAIFGRIALRVKIVCGYIIFLRFLAIKNAE
jgi:hypothetical protein